MCTALQEQCRIFEFGYPELFALIDVFMHVAHKAHLFPHSDCQNFPAKEALTSVIPRKPWNIISTKNIERAKKKGGLLHATSRENMVFHGETLHFTPTSR